MIIIEWVLYTGVVISSIIAVCFAIAIVERFWEKLNAA